MLSTELRLFYCVAIHQRRENFSNKTLILRCTAFDWLDFFYHFVKCAFSVVLFQLHHVYVVLLSLRDEWVKEKAAKQRVTMNAKSLFIRVVRIKKTLCLTCNSETHCK